MGTAERRNLEPGLDHGAIGNDGIFENYNNPIADEEALIFSFSFFNPVFINNLNITTNTGIFIDDRPANRGICTDSQGNFVVFEVSVPLREGLVEVSPH